MERSNLIELLGKSEAFSSAPPEALESLVDAGEIRSLEPSMELFQQGSMGDSIWMLLEGDLDVLVGDKAANRIREKGEVLGEISAVSHTPATATVISRSHGSGFCIPHQALHKIMKEYPSLAGSVLRSMAKYLDRL